GDPALWRQRGEPGPARPALTSVHHHRAGAAHPDAAGVAEGEVGSLALAHLDERVQHRGMGRRLHAELVEPTGAGLRAPAEDTEAHATPGPPRTGSPPRGCRAGRSPGTGSRSARTR